MTAHTELVVALHAGDMTRYLDQLTVPLPEGEVMPALAAAWVDSTVGLEVKLNPPGMAWLLEWREECEKQWQQVLCTIGEWRVRTPGDVARFVGVTVTMAEAPLLNREDEYVSTLKMRVTRL